MTDQQFKIRIQITQPPQSIEQQYPEPVAQEETDQPPLDWRKISLALLLLGSLLSLVSYALFDGSNDEPSLTEIVPPVDPATITNEIAIPPMDFQPKVALVEEAIESQENVSASEYEIKLEHTSPEDATIEIGINPETDTIAPTNALVAPSETTVPTLDSTVKDQPQVIRAQLSRAIQRREPVDIVDHIWLNQGVNERIYLFVQLRDLEGSRVSVHWYYKDKEVAKVNLKIGNKNWRTNASKLLTKTRLGPWRVELHDHSGKLLAQRNFTVSGRP